MFSPRLSVPMNEPQLEIVIQPKQHGQRFRYKCESKSAGSLLGEGSTNEQKVYPTVEIKHLNGLSAIIVVSCVSRDPPYHPHPHNLVGKDCKDGVCTVRLKQQQNTVNLMGVGIQCCKRNEVNGSLELRQNIRVDPFATGMQTTDKIDLSVVRLCFQAFLPDTNRRFTRVISPIVSQPIIDKKTVHELVIVRLSLISGSVIGGDDMIILCEKVKKDDIQIRFFEQSPEGDVVWEAYPDLNDLDVHHQYAIVFKTPPYRDPSITEPVTVFLQLHRPSTCDFGDPKPFMYRPADQDPDGFNAKRRKTAEQSYTSFMTDVSHLPKSLSLFNEDDTSAASVFGGTSAPRAKRKPVLKKERDQAASMSTALPTYSFDNVGGSFAAHGSSFAAAAADSGRYIQDDLPLTTVLLPDGTSVPMSSFAAANSALFTSPGMVNGGATTGLSASQAQQMVGQMMDSVIPGSDSLNLAGNINISGTLTSEDLTQYLQNGSMLTEMRSDEFLRQFDGIVFQQTNDSAAGPPPSSEQ